MSRRGRQDPESEEDGVDDDPSPAKRQRSGGPAAYPKGTVKEVKVFNFMTYGEPAVTIRPGARLNLVLGPNGTGKSSLVCALCVGLGGSTKLLGRADNVKDYIRRGCDRGWVETTLSGGPGSANIVIRCEMAKTDSGYKMDWRINRASKTKKEVQDLVKSLNIQFDNLCQFLPQDKVVQFAAMDQYELLVATEKAIGDASLHETHMALNEKRQLVKERQNAADASARRHEQLVGENQKLERDYERFKRRRNLQERVALMKKKYAWMGVRALQERAKEAGEEARQAQQAFNAAQAEANHDERPLKQRQQDAERQKKHATQLQQAVRAREGDARKAADQATKEEEAVRENRAKLQGLQKEKDDLEAKKVQWRNAIAKLEVAMANLPPLPDHTAENQQLQEQLSSLNEQLVAIEGDKQQLMHERGGVVREQAAINAQLRDVDSASGQRMAALMATHRGMQGLGGAWRWVQQQHAAGAFKGEVIGPLGLEIKVKRGRHAERLAQNLEQATWSQHCNFVCEHPDDEKLLMDTFRAQNLRSNVISMQPGAGVPVGDAARFRDYGVIATLDEVFDAPPLVKKALSNNCKLHCTYCVDHDDTDLVKRLMEEHGVRNVFTTKSLVNYLASSYGGKEDASTMSKGLMPLKVLGNAAGVDDERKQQLLAQQQQAQQRLQQLDQALQAKQHQEQPLNQQVEAVHQRRQQLAAEYAAARSRRQNMQTKHKQATTHLANLEKKEDPLKQAPALERKVAKALAMHHGALTAQIEAVTTQWVLLQQQVVADMSWRELDMQARAMQQALEARKGELRRLQAAAKAAAAAANTAKDAFTRARAEANAEHPLDDEAKRRFEQMPDDREELQEKIAELEVEVAGIAVNNPRVVEEYLKRKAEIERLAGEIAAQRAELDTLHMEIEQLKEEWLPKLQEVVGQINTSFAANFAQIGCAGEVLLSQHEDYDKFSIQIKVKFREHEDMQLLTAHRQSGGERSVSTILYLIALQGVTVTPFRVVDEINQGMDPANERKVFTQLVKASCQAGTPQCFLLTPKLLPDLHYTEDITILNIFNGGLVDAEVAGQYDRHTLFGTALDRLQGVPVVG
ncbi:hypothetical protein OEZ85_011696 [Tetradesmus obliquus]|uniref:Structural maintenance of chromosomes protein 5 n=1 Tax=Tetradesmus obliquus TaxID=3088 RepID=A0ABY8TR42_TETOB|nr:hypothetical protein OEZ85_011696 [Tetradesmus obliquus]